MRGCTAGETRLRPHHPDSQEGTPIHNLDRHEKEVKRRRDATNGRDGIWWLVFALPLSAGSQFLCTYRVFLAVRTGMMDPSSACSLGLLVPLQQHRAVVVEGALEATVNVLHHKFTLFMSRGCTARSCLEGPSQPDSWC